MVKYLKDNAAGIVTGAFTGKAEEQLSAMLEKAGQEIESAVEEEVKSFASKAFKEIMDR